MTVLQDILEWSHDRPAWQRDALRRLVVNGKLSEDDIHALADICKAPHGLAEPQDVTPLNKGHVPVKRHAAPPVALSSIFHHRGVNALAQNQTLRFGQNLTVVYGDNAAGKTGYIRILKSACRARGREKILGNVVAGILPPTPVVAIKYDIGTEHGPREWAGHGPDEFISRVSVFDTQCAAVYLTEKTDVAFRPFGLDLFDQLVRACKAIRTQLDREQRALASSALPGVQAQIPDDTAVARLLTNITSLTTPETVAALSRLSVEDEARLALLQKSLRDLQASDPEELIRRLTLRAKRVQGLVRHLKDVEAALSATAVDAVFNARTEGRHKAEEAKRLREATLQTAMLPGTGSESWTMLWESARRFSQDSPYPSRPFPVVDNGAQCVLCQQDLDHAARHRLQQLGAFVASTTERELRQARDTFVRLRRTFTDLTVTTASVDETLQEIRIEHAAVADTIIAAVAAADDRRKAIVLALSQDGELARDCPALMPLADVAADLEGQIAERVTTLSTSATDETRNRITAQARELTARKLLAQHEKTVLREIDRKRQYAAYGLCINDTRTQAITKKSTAVTRTVVTQKLKQSFQDELSRLGFRHVEVELQEVGGTEGVLYHKLILTRAPNVELPKVVSEGEQRCLSIAAFFAELSTADEPSGIVFDDPVSSLDYRWREGVAGRLVDEAKRRQVIVFTHDVVFVLLLRQLAADADVVQLDQHVRQLSSGAGVCAEELPWVALKVAKRIGYLKKQLQAAEKLYREGHQAAYEMETSVIYGYLREAWERGVEEVLLGGVVERYRPGVQTQQVTLIADIKVEDCKAVEIAMTKCSKWLPGHDQAAAARADIPEPASVKADIERLEAWVKAIRGRRP